MVSFRIEDKKKFTSELFLGEMFDHFLVREASFTTFVTFAIDGRTRQSYYSEQELEAGQIEDYAAWSLLKPFGFYLIKGKKLPERFHIVFQLPPKAVEHFVAGAGLPVSAGQIKGLYLNVRYEEGNIDCVTGNSVDFFTLDKSLDQTWDEAVRRFIREKGIAFT